jgi:hypothetical protein
MNFGEELKTQRLEIILYRCNCRHCDASQQELTRLAGQYGALLDIKQVDKEPGLEGYAGWRTPVVYINGRQITHYQVNAKAWESALKQGGVTAPSKVIGEIVDIHCYMSSKAKGEEHKACAERCIKAGQPIGLLTRNGQLYLLIQDKAYSASFESLKAMASNEVRITGDICERGGVQTMVVREVETV